MKKFTCITQMSSIATFRGPSGTNYNSLLGATFNVSNKEDIKHFENNSKRFKMHGLLKRGSTSPQHNEADKELSKWLKSLGVKAKEIKELVDRYQEKSYLVDDYLNGVELPKGVKDALDVEEGAIEPVEKDNEKTRRGMI